MPTSRKIIAIEPPDEQAQGWIDDMHERFLHKDLVDAARRILKAEGAQRASVSYTIEVTAGDPRAVVIVESDTDPRVVPRLIYRGTHE